MQEIIVNKCKECIAREGREKDMADHLKKIKIDVTHAALPLIFHEFYRMKGMTPREWLKEDRKKYDLQSKTEA